MKNEPDDHAQPHALSVRVRRRVPLAPLVVWSCILGALCGALASFLLVRPGWLANSGLRPLAILVLAGMVLVVPSMLLALWLARRCQRRVHVYLAGQAHCSSYVWSLLLVSALLGPGATAGLDLQTLVSALGAGLIAGVAGGLADLLLLLVNRTLNFRVLEQDGSLCGHCGYPVGAPPGSPRCPECGTPAAAQARPASRWLRALRSCGHWAALAMFCGLVSAILAHRFMVERAPTRNFLRAFDGGDHVFHGAILGGDMPGVWECAGVYRELPGRPGQTVMILFDATRDPGEPSMQVRLGTLTRTPAGQLVPVDARPLVMSSLCARPPASWTGIPRGPR